MAKIKFGPAVAAASGKTDGNVFSHNRSGPYLRCFRVPTNPDTTPQTAMRNRFNALTTAYRALTQNQRDGWTALGSQTPRQNTLGDSYTLTGAQAYIAYNLPILALGGTAVDDAPALADVFAFTFSTVTVDQVDGVDITYTSAGGATDYLQIWATAPVSAGRQFFRKSEYKLLGSLAGNAASPQDLTTIYQAVYGLVADIAAGQKISFKITPVLASGQRGTPTRRDAIVTT